MANIFWSPETSSIPAYSKVGRKRIADTKKKLLLQANSFSPFSHLRWRQQAVVLTFKNTIDCRRSQQNVLRSSIVCDYMKTKLTVILFKINCAIGWRWKMVSSKELDLLDKESIKLSPQMEVFKVRVRQKSNAFSFAYSCSNVELGWQGKFPWLGKLNFKGLVTPILHRTSKSFSL